jgi:hypothetical protein
VGIGSIDLSQVWQQILTLLFEPTSNLTAAFLLYGVITITLLVVIVGALMFLSAAPDDDEDDESAETEAPVSRVDAARTAISAVAPGEIVEGIDEKPLGRSRELIPGGGTPIVGKIARPPRSSRDRVISLGIGLLVIMIAWLLAGFSSSNASVCSGCHTTTPHSTAAEGKADPHAQETCVACHEPGGPVGRYFSGVPSRLLHFIDGVARIQTQQDYGRLTQSACLGCHGAALRSATFDKNRGIRMSHAEPLAAAVRCLGCHLPKDGVVGPYNAGMNPCLRCHDSGTASSACDTCHDKKAAAAARARTTSMASQQIQEVTCSGCHDEKRECDPCHGTRMPHSTGFKAVAHARAGAVDFWFTGGKACGKCHTSTRRPCQKCHEKHLGKGHGADMWKTHYPAAESACNTCHQRWAFRKGRNYCTDVCHTPEAIKWSPR